jgi:aminoglycoside phosphotransferase (APT) family kinase protein
MHFRNLIIGSKGEISGVIDWGDSHIGHPAVDLSIVYSFFPVEGRRQFFNIYGSVDFETQELARFKAVYTSLLLLLYGADLNDTELVKGAQEALNLALL